MALAQLIASEGKNTKEELIDLNIAKSYKAICDGPSAPIWTPA